MEVGQCALPSSRPQAPFREQPGAEPCLYNGPDSAAGEAPSLKVEEQPQEPDCKKPRATARKKVRAKQPPTPGPSTEEPDAESADGHKEPQSRSNGGTLLLVRMQHVFGRMCAARLLRAHASLHACCPPACIAVRAGTGGGVLNHQLVGGLHHDGREARRGRVEWAGARGAYLRAAAVPGDFKAVYSPGI